MSRISSGAVSPSLSPIVRATIGLVTATGLLASATLAGSVSIAFADSAGREGPAPIPSSQPPIAQKAGDELRVVPELTLDKTVDQSSVSSAGQLLTYSFAATNTGQTALFNVRIIDELPGLSELSCTPDPRADLEPGDQLSCVATRPVTQDDLDLGVISNSAQVLGEAPGGNPADPSDDVAASGDVTVDAVQEPALSITLATAAEPARAGDLVPVTATMTNTGNVTLTSAIVATGLSQVSCDAGAESLSPGASAVCTGRYRVTRSDADRGVAVIEATARAEGPYGADTDRSDDVTAKDSLRIAVEKAATPTQPPVQPSTSPTGEPSTPDPSGSPGDTPGPGKTSTAPSIIESRTAIPTHSSGEGPLPETGGVSPLIPGVGGILTLIGAGLVVRSRTRGRTRV